MKQIPFFRCVPWDRVLIGKNGESFKVNNVYCHRYLKDELVATGYMYYKIISELKCETDIVAGTEEIWYKPLSDGLYHSLVILPYRLSSHTEWLLTHENYDISYDLMLDALNEKGNPIIEVHMDNGVLKQVYCSEIAQLRIYDKEQQLGHLSMNYQTRVIAAAEELSKQEKYEMLELSTEGAKVYEFLAREEILKLRELGRNIDRKIFNNVVDDCISNVLEHGFNCNIDKLSNEDICLLEQCFEKAMLGKAFVKLCVVHLSDGSRKIEAKLSYSKQLRSNDPHIPFADLVLIDEVINITDIMSSLFDAIVVTDF